MDVAADRFVMDLEFVQALANPDYTIHLLWKHATDNNFWNYLKSLQYWTNDPKYKRYIQYPLGLFMLELLIQDREASIDSLIDKCRLIKQQMTAQFEYQQSQ